MMSLSIDCEMRIVDSHGINKMFSSKFKGCYWISQSSEEAVKPITLKNSFYPKGDNSPVHPYKCTKRNMFNKKLLTDNIIMKCMVYFLKLVLEVVQP